MEEDDQAEKRNHKRSQTRERKLEDMVEAEE